MAETPKAAAAGTKRKARRPADWEGIASDIGSGLRKAGEAVGDVVSDVWNPPALEREKQGLPLQEKDVFSVFKGDPAKFEADKAAAQGKVDERDAAYAELAELNRYGSGAPIATRSAAYTEIAQGSSKPFQRGTKTTTRQRPAWTDQQLQDWSSGLEQESKLAAAQLTARAAGKGVMFDAWNDLALEQQEQVYPLVLQANKIFDEADKQLVGIQEMADDVRANRINPGQFFANIGDAGVFAASMAVAAGHLASAMGGGPNTAMGVINGVIERNMRAQELNQAHDRAVLNSEIMILDRMRALGVDRLNQANVFNGLLISHAQSVMEGIAAATASVELQYQAGIIQAQLAQKKQEKFMAAEGAITQVLQMKLMALGDSARSQAQAKANQIMLEYVEQSEQLPPEERLNWLRQFQSKTGTAIPPEIVAQIQGNDVSLGRQPTTHFTPPSQENVIRFEDSVTGAVSELIPNERFMGLKKDGPESQEKIKQKMEAQYKYSKNWEQIAILGGTLQVAYGGDSLKELITHSDTEFFETKGGTEDPRITELIVRMNQAVAQNAIALSGRMEAIRGIGEQAILAMRAGLPGSTTAMANILFADDMFNILQPGAKIAAQSAQVEIGKYTK